MPCMKRKRTLWRQERRAQGSSRRSSPAADSPEWSRPLFLAFSEQMNLTDGRVTQTPTYQLDYAENNTIEKKSLLQEPG